MSAARDVTDVTFAAEVLNNDKPVIVDFWARGVGRVALYRRFSTPLPRPTQTRLTSSS